MNPNDFDQQENSKPSLFEKFKSLFVFDEIPTTSAEGSTPPLVEGLSIADSPAGGLAQPTTEAPLPGMGQPITTETAAPAPTTNPDIHTWNRNPIGPHPLEEAPTAPTPLGDSPYSEWAHHESDTPPVTAVSEPSAPGVILEASAKSNPLDGPTVLEPNSNYKPNLNPEPPLDNPDFKPNVDSEPVVPAPAVETPIQPFYGARVDASDPLGTNNDDVTPQPDATTTEVTGNFVSDGKVIGATPIAPEAISPAESIATSNQAGESVTTTVESIPTAPEPAPGLTDASLNENSAVINTVGEAVIPGTTPASDEQQASDGLGMKFPSNNGVDIEYR